MHGLGNGPPAKDFDLHGRHARDITTLGAQKVRVLVITGPVRADGFKPPHVITEVGTPGKPGIDEGHEVAVNRRPVARVAGECVDHILMGQ